MEGKTEGRQRAREQRRGGNASAGAPFPSSLSVLSCVLGPGLFHLHFQLLQLNGAAAFLSVVENETQQRTQENQIESANIPQTLLCSAEKKKVKNHTGSLSAQPQKGLWFISLLFHPFSEELFFMLQGLWVASPHKFRKLLRKGVQGGKSEVAEPPCSRQQ